MEVDHGQLVRGLVRKDQDALALLLRVFGPKLKGWLRSRFGTVLQSQELDEALSVTAFNAWRFADRFDPARAPLGAWLIAIASNAARSIVRGQKHHRCKHLEYDEIYDPAWDVEINAQSQNEDDVERLRDLETAIARLPTLQRTVIEADLASNGHTDDARLATIHGTTKNSIQVSRHKAIKSLLGIMSSIGYDSKGRKARDEE